MAISNLPKYKDMRGKLNSNGSYTEYPLYVKDTIVVHHSLTKTGSAEAYANYHVDTLGWEGIGYHFVIEQDGTIKQCHNIGILSYHVGNSNKRSIGICLTGDFRKGIQKPTEEQKISLYLLIKQLRAELATVKYVKGHQEMPGYAWKNCPGDNWDYRTVVAGENVNMTPAPTPQPKPEPVVITTGGVIGVVRVLADTLNVRAGRGTDTAIIAKLPKGKEYGVFSNVNDWHEIHLENGQTGYIFGNKGEYLKLLMVRVKATNLNIRSGAGTQYASIGKAPTGAVYALTANINDWHEVILPDGKKGFIFGNKGEYLELV